VDWIHLRLQVQSERAVREKKKNILYRLNDLRGRLFFSPINGTGLSSIKRFEKSKAISLLGQVFCVVAGARERNPKSLLYATVTNLRMARCFLAREAGLSCELSE